MTDPSPDIWKRLESRDRFCDITMHAFDLPDDHGKMERNWDVTIRRKDSSEEPIRVRGLSLLKTIGEALDQADARGWPGSD